MNLQELENIESLAMEALESFIPFASVKEKDDFITVAGINSNDLFLAMRQKWKTSRVYIGIFFDDGYRYIRFHKFYAVEFVYILSQLMEEKRCTVSKGTLQSILSQMYKNTWLKDTTDDKVSLNFNYSRLSELHVKPFSYQQAYLEDFEKVVAQYNLEGYLAELAAGSGKTLLAYFFSVVSEADLTIILAPKPTISQIWVDTLNSQFKRPQIYWDSVTGGDITGSERYIICHHQAIDKVLDVVRKLRRKKSINIWLDESHKFTEESSGLVQKLYKLKEKLEPRFIVHASATPLKARPTEAIPLLKTIDPNFKGKAVDSYVKVFGASKAVALDILNNRLGIVKFKVTKDQYSQIEETEHLLEVTVPDSHKYELDYVRDLMAEKAEEYIQEYQENKEQIVDEFNRLHGIVVSKSPRREELKTYKRYADSMHRGFDMKNDIDMLRYCKNIEKEIHLQILEREDKKMFKALSPMYKYPALSIKGKLLGNVLGKQRIQCFVDMARNMEFEKIIDSAVKKTVIFTSYVDVAKAAQEYCIEKGYEPIIVNQETNHMLPALLKKAETDPKANPIIATYQSLGTGNELVMCSTYVAIDVPWRSYIVVQSRARINRASQDTDVTYYDATLVTKSGENLSTRNLDILKWSQEQVDEMLGLDGDIYDEDIKLLSLKGFK